MLSTLLSAALLQSAQPAPPPEPTPEQWRAAARQDVEAVHDTLRDNAPFMVVDRDSAGPRRWLEQGRAEALADLPKVVDQQSYRYVLYRYIRGFRDGHIQTGPAKGAAPDPIPAWPGFAMTWRDGGYRVGWVDPAAGDTPPVGAVLVGCDGQPAEALAQARLDRLVSNLQLEANRGRSAFQLLRDYRYPGGRPTACTFRTAAGEKTWTLAWSTPSDALVKTASASLQPPSARFGVDRWGANAWWIGAPTMSGEAEWKALYAKVEANQAAIRAADVVVIDLRGNGGGNSEFGDGLAKRLFGEDVVKAHPVSWGELVFKVGPLSRQWTAEGVERAKGNPEWLADAKTTADKLQAAPLGSRVVFPPDPVPPPPATPPVSPMKGRVVVLVDSACASACLDTLDLFTRLPGVKLAGVETNADTIFMDLMEAPLPSGKARFFFGIKAWSQRVRGSNTPTIPIRPCATPAAWPTKAP